MNTKKTIADYKKEVKELKGDNIEAIQALFKDGILIGKQREDIMILERAAVEHRRDRNELIEEVKRLQTTAVEQNDNTNEAYKRHWKTINKQKEGIEILKQTIRFLIPEINNT